MILGRRVLTFFVTDFSDFSEKFKYSFILLRFLHGGELVCATKKVAAISLGL